MQVSSSFFALPKKLPITSPLHATALTVNQSLHLSIHLCGLAGRAAGTLGGSDAESVAELAGDELE